MSEPLWAMAAGCVPEVPPWEIPRIAHAGGFTSSGMWIDPDTTWQGDAQRKTLDALAETGIRLVDVEVGWLGDGSQPTDRHKQIVDAGIALGARNVLIVSRHDDFDASVRQFQALCERAAGEIRIVLEFGEFATIRSLREANRFIDAVDHPEAGILIDLMHINRSGEDLPDLPDERYPYVQACDFYASSSTLTGREYIGAAVDDRCPLGEGDADRAAIAAVCQAPVDVSLEIRSKALRDEYPDPVARARAIYERCQRSAF
jgi:sugar phosphate isomerase/epimerase